MKFSSQGKRTQLAPVKGPGRTPFEELLRRHERQIYRVAYRMAGNHDDAEDLIQETVVDALTSFHYFEEGTRFDRWFYRIMTNNYIDRTRRRARTPTVSIDQPVDYERTGEVTLEIPDEESDPQRVLLSGIMEEEIQKALNQLPEEFRTVVILSDIEDLSYEEIRQVLKCPIGTVRSRLHRGRNIMKRLLKHTLRIEGSGEK